MENKKIKYFVVSLPRTGTLSICNMAKIVGLNPKHTSFNWLVNTDEYDFYSDTPVYNPNIVEKICNKTNFESKFIYIIKDYDKIFNSWVKIKLYKNYLEFLNPEIKVSQPFDKKNYVESFNEIVLSEENYNEVFETHKNMVLEKIKEYNKEILLYKFDDGWDSFCDFVNKPIPNVEIPHLNINTMFDKIS